MKTENQIQKDFKSPEYKGEDEMIRSNCLTKMKGTYLVSLSNSAAASDLTAALSKHKQVLLVLNY